MKGTSATFTLDALGRFATRVLSAGGTDTYAYLGATETVAEISNPTAGIIRSLLDLGGSRLATRAGSAGGTFTLFDHLGSLTGLVDSTRTILDNVSTHKTPRTHRWLARHPRYHLHFAPTGGSLLNLVERFFALVTETRVRPVVGASSPTPWAGSA